MIKYDPGLNDITTHIAKFNEQMAFIKTYSWNPPDKKTFWRYRHLLMLHIHYGCMDFVMNACLSGALNNKNAPVFANIEYNDLY